MQPLSLDGTDIRILNVLQRDGRISNLELAEQVALSPSACLRRVRLLEEQGIISSYRAHLSLDVLGFELEAFVHVSMRNDKANWHERFTAAMEAAPEVIGIYVITGDSHYMLRVLTSNLKHYSSFIMNTLYKAPGVMDIRSNIVLQTVKEHAGVPAALLSPVRSDDAPPTRPARDG
ncbi:MAG: Lrp/AsnC family transcriptional regulator [Janthinobacterium lividum]